MQRTIVVYDVRDDKRRQKVYATLKNYATRVQYSVFEGILSDEDMLRLEQELLGSIDQDKDSVIMYKPCASCYKNVERIGSCPEVYGEDDIIV